MIVDGGAKLDYFVGLKDSGPVWEVSWSPVVPGEHRGIQALGMLAVVCGDGTCRVLVLPASLGSDSSTADCELPVLAESEVCRWSLRMPPLKHGEDRVAITCVCWQSSGRLVCGTASGHVTIW